MEGGEVAVEAGEIAVAFVECEAAEEGFAGGVDLAEDAGIAGKIVVVDGFLAQGWRGGEEGLDGFAGAAQFMETIGGVDPAAFLLGSDFGQLAGEGEGVAPFALVDEDEDPHLEDIGPMLGGVGEAVEFPPGFAPEAEFVVALCGQDALLEVFHVSINCKGQEEGKEGRGKNSKFVIRNSKYWMGEGDPNRQRVQVKVKE